MSLFVGESKFLLLWMMATVFNAIFQSQQQRPCQQPQQATAERKYLGAEQLIPNRICQGSKCHQALLGKIAQVHPEIHIRPSAGNQPARQSGQEIRQCQCCHQRQRECGHLTPHLSKRGQPPQLMQEEQCSNRQWYPCDRIYDLTQCASWQQLCAVFRKSGTLQKILYCSTGVVSVLDFQGGGCKIGRASCRERV